MSNNMMSQQFPAQTSLGQLETASGSNHSGQMGLMGLGMNGLSGQHMSISNVQMEMVAPGVSSASSHQMSESNMQTEVSDQISMNFGSEVQPTSNHQSSYIGLQGCDGQWQSFIVPNYSAAGTAVISNSSASQELLGKRKSPVEPVFNGSPPQKLLVPQKRMTQLECRPWLQQISSADNGSIQMQPTSVSPRMQYLPTPSKKIMQVESVSNKSGKQSMNRKQSVQVQPSPKAQNDVNEAVRSKMRESLAAALALVKQQNESPKGDKNSSTEVANFPGKDRESSQPIESVSTASRAEDPVAEGAKSALPTSGESSVCDASGGRIALQETSTNGKTSDTKQLVGQESQCSDAFPQYDVSFSDDIFAKDELLQGNGLSWVLEPVTEFGEKENEMDEASRSHDEKVARVEGEQSFQDPELLAFKIEAELFKLFGGVNKKYKEKGRSLLFNLKDKKNPELRERVMSGEILPERLCSMTAEELASKELFQWRQAKAKELADMVVLHDTEVDIRRLVKKTHKGEFQVEVEPVESSGVEVSAGVSLFSQPRSKVKEKESSPPAEAARKSDESNDRSTEKDQGASCTITLPSSEGTDPMQGLSVDDEMKDAEFLPPIVSLDEFMESLNSEPPFEAIPSDAGGETPVPENSDLEIRSDLKSPRQAGKEPVDVTKEKPVKTITSSPKPDVDVKISGSSVRSETTPPVPLFKGESVWDGILQLSISSVTLVNGIFKSGEKISTSEWPALIEVKGRVRLDAFGKFLQQLPMSRSRAVMVMYFLCKEGQTKSGRGNLSEVAESYFMDRRVGFAEPASGMELYLCPPRGETLDMLSKIVSKDQLHPDLKTLDSGLIGVVVWKRPQSVSTVSPRAASRHKSTYKRQHSSSRRPPQDNKNKGINVNHASIGPDTGPITVRTHDSAGGEDNDEDDVPPGFGPETAKDDDDLPEFTFSSGRQLLSQAPSHSHSHSVDQVRELIHKYGKPTGGVSSGIQPWNNDDDDDDIPEWQPQAPQPRPPPVGAPPGYNYRAQMVNQAHSGTLVRQATNLQQQPNVLHNSEGWWAYQSATGGRYHGTPRGGAQPRSRRF